MAVGGQKGTVVNSHACSARAINVAIKSKGKEREREKEGKKIKTKWVDGIRYVRCMQLFFFLPSFLLLLIWFFF